MLGEKSMQSELVMVSKPGPDCARKGRCLLEPTQKAQGLSCCKSAPRRGCRFWEPPQAMLDSEIAGEECIKCPVVGEARRLHREIEASREETSHANDLVEHYKHKMRDLAGDLRRGERACTEILKMLSEAASTASL